MVPVETKLINPRSKFGSRLSSSFSLFSPKQINVLELSVCSPSNQFSYTSSG